MTKDWKETYTKILNDWFKRVMELSNDDFLDRAKGKAPGFWAVEGKELEQFIESNFLSKEDLIKMVESKMINKQALTMDEASYNMALDDIIKEIKSTK